MAAKQSLGDKLTATKDDDLTNGVVLEIFTHYKIMNGAVDWCALKDSVYSIFGLLSESISETQLRTIFNAVHTRKCAVHGKRRMNDLHAFLDESFKRPNDAALIEKENELIPLNHFDNLTFM